jgi:hypothetical protein
MRCMLLDFSVSSAMAVRADFQRLALTLRKSTGQIPRSIYRTVNGLPKGPLYLQFGSPQTCVLEIRPLQRP